ncbi:hypothetical protein SAMN05444166_6487 [Singulisphaera sp. GP187]|nr:hypothetical protein SAMN05444166_6487 [Singulisphaera sp. GP187]
MGHSSILPLFWQDGTPQKVSGPILSNLRKLRQNIGMPPLNSPDSERGSRFVERILTVVASCRSQSRDVLKFLTQAIMAHQNGSQKPSILGEGA